MIYGKMWLVVKPTVGVPLFLGAVAVGSFSVHLAIMSNTTWVKKFLNGAPAAATATVEAPAKIALAPPEAK
ncbi:MAG: light-harvesting protein [Betaproteobacteria bacterium]|jgi:light-harvesting protein B-800-850 alpha chain|nr:light-harvesting protein [Betaproteobacteria bacterium]NBU49681.1 light-harvesting protein [Betaproteobacteria bacterium]NBX96542.1 light-harvesting protein [Betaproteobacteria bacterium]